MTRATQNLSQRFPAKRAFITGAASGLGLACAEWLAREGWRLVLTDVDEARLSLVADSLAREGAQVAAAPSDVRDAAALTRLVDDAVGAIGGVDLALHCAGVATAGSFLGSAPEDWQWVFDINVHGTVNSCRAVAPHMQRQRSGGVIVNIASAASFVTNSHMSSYNAAKAAVVALSETLMQELAQHDIQVTVAMPGFFRTRLLEGARGPEKTVAGARRVMEDSNLSAEIVADALLTAVARGQTHFVYPGRYRTLWRLKRLMPSYFQKLVPRLLRR